MQKKEECQVFVGGIQKFSNEKDFAKYIEKNVPNYTEIVLGAFKKKDASAICIRLVSEEAKVLFIDFLTDKLYKNRTIRIKDQFPPHPPRMFHSIEKLLKPNEKKTNIMAEEDIKEEMDKDLKDKLIPFHNVPYEEQISRKEDFLKEIFAKFVTRIEKGVKSKQEKSIPSWLAEYWSSKLPEPIEGEEDKEDEEEKDDEDAKTPLKFIQKLPCDFKGILECDEEARNGYRNKVEFSISRNYHDKKLCVGFMKCNTNKGLLYVDYPKDLPHISNYSVECAEKVQTLVREYEEKYGIQEYRTDIHTGSWRTMLYKESKKTNEVLISIAISRNSMIDDQLEQFKKDFLKLWEGEQRVVSVSIIESDSIAGNFEHYDKVIYLTERKTYIDELNGFKFSVSPQAFFQVNSNVFEKILHQIKDWAELDENTVLLDV
jgi:hypothetical protein